MIKTSLNSTEMGLLSTAYMKELFPKPYKGELLVSPVYIIDDKEICHFYFMNRYFDELINHINSEVIAGKFSKSNAESEWMGLIETLKTNIQTDRTESSVIKEYWLSKG